MGMILSLPNKPFINLSSQNFKIRRITPPIAPKTEPDAKNYLKLFGFRRAFVRNGKPLTAIFSAVCQYSASIGSRHTLTETVLIHSFLLGGLVGTFHNSSI
jgi:hypothetical protein